MTQIKQTSYKTRTKKDSCHLSSLGVVLCVYTARKGWWVLDYKRFGVLTYKYSYFNTFAFGKATFFSEKNICINIDF